MNSGVRLMKDSKEQFAVINGAYGGMGEAIAKKLAENGHSLILLGRNKKKLQDTQSKLQDVLHKNRRIVCYEVDVTNNIGMNAASQDVEKNDYYVEVMVNAVGVVPIGSIQDVSEDHWENAIQTSLMSAIRLIKNFSPLMMKNKSGKIVLINGVLSRQPDPNLIISSTITGAINNFAKALSRDIGRHNIRVNTINPGATATPLWEGLVKDLACSYQVTEETITSQAKAQTPLGRIANVRDIANAVGFLCGENSEFINGAFITIDGGASVAY
jgi:NAD(P)-dependent dehydrogenase (short-subunit alcohol dehydrogenase family)